MAIWLLGGAQLPCVMVVPCHSAPILLDTHVTTYPPAPVSTANYSQVPAQGTNQISPQ